MNAALLVLAFVVQDTVALKPVVVTATRFPVSVDIVAAAVTVLRGEDLRAQGIRTIGEALRGVAGAAVVETGSFGGQTSLFLRGGESDYTKVLLDGVPLNRAGGGLDLAPLTTDNVDRIEIVRGPGSVLYGSDAMTGVIQIFTRTGQGRPRVGGELRAGTYGTTDGAIDVSGGGPRVSYALRGSRFESDGLYAYNNAYRNAVVSARVRVAPDARTDASLAYRYGGDVYHIPADGAGEPADSNAFSTERGPAVSLSVNRAFGARLDARVLATLGEGRLAFTDDADSPGEDGSFRSRDYVRRAGGGALVTWRVRGSALTAGVDYEDERQRGRSEFSASYGTFPDSIAVQRSTTGYYLQALLGAEGPIAVTLGARVDDNSQFGGHGTRQHALAGCGRDGFQRADVLRELRAWFRAGEPQPRPRAVAQLGSGVRTGPRRRARVVRRDLLRSAVPRPHRVHVDAAPRRAQLLQRRRGDGRRRGGAGRCDGRAPAGDRGPIHVPRDARRGGGTGWRARRPLRGGTAPHPAAGAHPGPASRGDAR